MTSAPTQSATGHPRSAVSKLSLFAADIKITHTLFALPWAILSTFLAAKETHHPITLTIIVLILGCMVTARTVAMAANRLLDAELDAKNPRTARRAVPSGALSRRFYGGMLAMCALGFILLTSGFWFLVSPANPWPLLLSTPVLGFVCCYPLLKRFTRLCHYYLGAALALAPVCAWVAIAGQIAWPPVLMAGAVLLWTAGFDILYACQDYRSDLETGVFSVPSKLGIVRALWVSRLTHLCCAGLLVTLLLTSATLSTFFAIAVVIACILLVVEHLLVKANDLSKLNLAFFTINGVISLLIATLGLIDIFRVH